MDQRYPGYTKLKQSLGECGSRMVDRLQIKTQDGEVRTITFDITDFFGKS